MTTVGMLYPGEQVAGIQRELGDHPDAEAVLIPDTAMHTLSILDDLEQAVGKPVLTANRVTVWKGLDLASAGRRIGGLGTLFAEPVTAGGRS